MADEIDRTAESASFAGKYREICRLRLVIRDALALANKFKVFPPNSLRIGTGNFGLNSELRVRNKEHGRPPNFGRSLGLSS